MDTHDESLIMLLELLYAAAWSSIGAHVNAEGPFVDRVGRVVLVFLVEGR